MGDGLYNKKHPEMSNDEESGQEGGEVVELRQCTAVLCGPPPQIAHATFKVHDAVTGDEIQLGGALGLASVNYETILSYKCDEGYSLNGDQSGLTEFTVSCGP